MHPGCCALSECLQQPSIQVPCEVLEVTLAVVGRSGLRYMLPWVGVYFPRCHHHYHRYEHGHSYPCVATRIVMATDQTRRR